MIRILKILNIIGCCIFGLCLGLALKGSKFYLNNTEFVICAIIGVVYASANQLYFAYAEDKKEDFFSLWFKVKKKKLKKQLKDLDD